MKPQYGPIPIRAFADTRLTALDLRVLGIIAAHDRLGNTGDGCWAGHERLGGIVRASLKSISRSIARLLKFGYVSERKLSWDHRRRIYSVIYTPDDLAVFNHNDRPDRGTSANHMRRKADADQVTQSVTDKVTENHTMVTGNGQIGNPDISVTHGNHSDWATPIQEENQLIEPSRHAGRARSTSNKNHLIVEPPFPPDKGESLNSIRHAWEAFKGRTITFSKSEESNLRKSIRRNGEATILHCIAIASDNAFLRGEQGNWSAMPLSWLSSDDRINQIMRGDYDQADSKAGVKSSGGIVADLRRALDSQENHR